MLADLLAEFESTAGALEAPPVGQDVLDDARALLEAAAADATAVGGWTEAEPLRLAKGSVTWLVRCPRRAVAPPQDGTSDELVLGSIVDAAAKLAALGARRPITASTALAYLGALGETAAADHLSAIGPPAAKALLADADDRVARLLAAWASTPPPAVPVPLAPPLSSTPPAPPAPSASDSPVPRAPSAPSAPSVPSTSPASPAAPEPSVPPPSPRSTAGSAPAVPVPAVSPEWWPRVEEPARVRLAGGAVTVTGRLDVLLGGPPTGRPGVVVEVKGGRWYDGMRADAHLYALLVGLRDGEAPARVVTLVADGTTQVEPIRPTLVLHAAERVELALRTAARLAAGEVAEARPGSHCGHCPVRAECPVAA